MSKYKSIMYCQEDFKKLTDMQLIFQALARITPNKFNLKLDTDLIQELWRRSEK